MNYRLFSLLVSFSLVTTAFAGPADVQSREVKVQICKNLVSEQFRLEGRRARTVESDCVNNGKFLAMEELRDSELNISTGLRVQFTYSYKDQLSAQGEALVLKNFRTSDEGQLSHSWEVRRLTLARLEDGDARSTEDLLNEIGEAANISNGSWQVVKFNVKRFRLSRELDKLEKDVLKELNKAKKILLKKINDSDIPYSSFEPQFPPEPGYSENLLDELRRFEKGEIGKKGLTDLPHLP